MSKAARKAITPLDIAEAMTMLNSACTKCLAVLETCADMLKNETLTPAQLTVIARRLENAGEEFRNTVWPK